MAVARTGTSARTKAPWPSLVAYEPPAAQFAADAHARPGNVTSPPLFRLARPAGTLAADHRPLTSFETKPPAAAGLAWLPTVYSPTTLQFVTEVQAISSTPDELAFLPL